MAHVCFATGGKNTFAKAQCEQLIELHQTDFDQFTVYYGLSVSRHKSYASAAKELGACIMHLRACNGHLDNRTAAEARADGDRAPYFAGA